MVGLTLLAAAFRMFGLFHYTFHADEALYASWGRLIGIWRDPLLLSQSVDKPPLLFYLQALFFPLAGGPDEWAARLPNWILSLFQVPLVAQLTWRVYRDRLATLGAAGLVALSPLAIQFSPTAFTDPAMVTFCLAALALQPLKKVSAPRQAYFAGLFLGLGLATKESAILFGPLFLSLGALMGWRRQQWKRATAGLLTVIPLLVVWQLLRDVPPWVSMYSNYGGLRVIYSWELWQRLSEWAGLWQNLIGSPLLVFGLILTMPLFLALLIHDLDWPTAYDQLFLINVIGYFLLHWFITIQVWDRYLLPLVPITAILLGRFGSRVVQFAGESLGDSLPAARRTVLPVLVLLLLLTPGAVKARRGGFPVGGQPGADLGASQIAAYLEPYPYGTVLYDQWFSWHWRYYLLDETVYAHWIPDPQALVSDLDVFGESDGDRFLVLPPDDRAIPLRRAVEEAGFTLSPRFLAHHDNGVEAMGLYEIRTQ